MGPDTLGLLIPIVAIATGGIIAITSIYTKYRLNVEQIKADAMVKAEEIRARNQYDIERMIMEDRNFKDSPKIDSDTIKEDESGYTERRTSRRTSI
ncbi:MAG: hypothetical protein N2489_00715 [Clostridia bacterium]|nr:hypothetical protein [Clostridia bacterium]